MKVGANSSMAMNHSVAGAAASASAEATIAGSVNGQLNSAKDVSPQEASTAPKFNEVLQQIQAKYGARPEKPREIKKTLGKDDFLKIMITQMKHQDPTSPFKADQMAAQMAQFASVEQLQNVNQSLGKMATANQPVERMAMTNMIGKVVTVDRERFPHTEGQSEALSFVLPRDAKDVKVAIVSETGETVFEKDLGSLKSGENSFSWDGTKINTLPAKAGTYLLRVAAIDEKEQAIDTNPQARTRVVGVSFEGSEPVFLVGDARSQAKVTMRNIVRVETDQDPNAPVTSLQQGVAPQKKNNFFTFQKGVGSTSVDPSTLPQEAQEAVKKLQESTPAETTAEESPAALSKTPPAQTVKAIRSIHSPYQTRPVKTAQEAAAVAMAGHDETKGFPNGLQESFNDSDLQSKPQTTHLGSMKGGERR